METITYDTAVICHNRCWIKRYCPSGENTSRFATYSEALNDAKEDLANDEIQDFEDNRVDIYKNTRKEINFGLTVSKIETIRKSLTHGNRNTTVFEGKGILGIVFLGIHCYSWYTFFRMCIFVVLNRFKK